MRCHTMQEEYDNEAERQFCGGMTGKERQKTTKGAVMYMTYYFDELELLKAIRCSRQVRLILSIGWQS